MYSVYVFFFLAVYVPICFIVSYGLFFLVFIGGVEKKTSYLKQLFSNSISMVAFMLRFFLQNMRIILIVVYSLLFSIMTEDEINHLLVNFSHSPSIVLFLSSLKFLFEVVDVMLIFCVQLFAFITVITCLFSFVLIIEENFNYESFFFFKKKK